MSARRSSCRCCRSTSPPSRRCCSSSGSSPSAAAAGSRIKDLGRVSHRARPDAAGAAHPARHAGAGRDRRRRCALLLAAITSDPVLCVVHRGGADLGGAFQRRHRAAGHVARLFAIRHASRRRSRWCSAPISAAPSIRCSRAAVRGDPASYRLPVGNLLNRLVGVVLVAAVPASRSRAACPHCSRTRRR